MKFCLLFLVTVLFCNALSQEFVQPNSYYNGNSKIGELILNDIDLMDSPLNKTIAYKRFFDEMVQHDGMYSIAGITLGYQVSQLSKQMAYNEELDFIMANLLPEIKNAPWNMTVTLYNMLGKYECSSNEQYSTKLPYYKVTTLEILEARCYWVLNVEANGRYFTIKNRANHQYLFAADNSINPGTLERSIFTIANVSNIVDQSNKWQLEPVRNKEMQYRIKNVGWGEYVFLDLFNIKSWKQSGCDGDKCFWKIETDNSQLSVEREAFLSKYYNEYYGKDNIASALLKHAANSTTKIMEYRNLYDLMNKHDGLFSALVTTLDYNVYKLLQEKPNDPNLMYLAENLQKHFGKFPWNRPVTFGDLSQRLYLCHSNNFSSNSTYFEDYTLVPSLSCQWIIEADSDDLSFRIRNIATGAYLFAAPNEYNKNAQERRVFVTERDEINLNYMKQWQIEWTYGFYARIKNAYWDEYLYFEQGDILSHDLMTWRAYGCQFDGCYWRISDAVKHN